MGCWICGMLWGGFLPALCCTLGWKDCLLQVQLRMWSCTVPEECLQGQAILVSLGCDATL